MRPVLILVPAMLLAACGSGNDAPANQAPATEPTAPAPNTPVENTTPMLGNDESWMDARRDTGDPEHAPYGNLLDQPLVDAPHKK